MWHSVWHIDSLCAVKEGVAGAGCKCLVSNYLTLLVVTCRYLIEYVSMWHSVNYCCRVKWGTGSGELLLSGEVADGGDEWGGEADEDEEGAGEAEGVFEAD